ncbi:MAG: hypothetical protein JNL92_12555 [Opitutaceae bacterium]|nr:hypothetical protein [Opitutaceae bacterium]
MNDDFLKNRLRRVVRRYQWVSLWRKLAVCWAVAALLALGLGWLQTTLGWNSSLMLPVVLAVTLGVVVTIGIFHFLTPPDLRWVAQRIEKRHPELNGLLLTAVQQQVEGGQPGYLQYRVLQEATARSQEQDWRDTVPGSRLVVGQVVHLVALVCFGFALGNFKTVTIHGEAPKWVGSDGVAITPGDASVERGESLVVLARFGGALPPSVNLVVRQSGAAARTIPLVKSLADPVFGGSVMEVDADFTYHLEYRGQKTKDFKVSVFEHPKLVRSDVGLTFPDYTKLPPKHIEDTRRVSAVEGTKLDFALQLNKPVKSAKLVSRDREKQEIPLQVSADKAVATLPAFVPEKSRSYDLQLVDAEGRSNKVAAPFVIDVQPNRPPELRLASPRGDVRPSALEEVQFDGTVFDDFGLSTYGIAYSLAGQEPKFLELGRDGAAKEKKSFAHLMKLEELGAKPDDLISWYVWADDTGPDGKPRRTNGDLYFAEVRPFDEIFRESQNMESGEQQGGGGQAEEAQKLTELQKQIINATWKLQRDGRNSKYAEDIKVVTDSQVQALAQAKEAAEEARSPRQQAMWKSVTQEMEKAIEKLKDAAKDPGPLAQALPAEQAAYQALLRMQARETAVTRRNRKQGGGGGGKQGNQRQIDELDLKQEENRYETQRQARSPQNPERREQLAVMNRLQELARRQQDLNERLKELQTALQEAKTEEQREEIKRRLKRLEEEQRQMLADADEVQQRMDRAQNQANMSEQRQQLEQTREDIQKAADAAAQGSVAQALASGTRAQRQLQQMRDDMRKQNSSEFAEDLREMRNEARELSRQQEEVGQKLDQLATGAGQAQRKSLGESTDRKDLLDKLAEQKERMNKIVEKATQISEQAENTEPLLSRQLYDSVRKLSQDDANTVKQARSELLNGGRMTRDLYDRLQKTAESDEGGKSLDLTREMLKEGYLPQARQAGQGARTQIEDLRRGVERAAESVLGDDAEQLKLARSELDALTDQLQREVAQAGNGQPGTPGREGQPPGQTPGERGQGDQRQAGTQPGQRGEPQPGQPGAEGQEPGQPGQGQPGREGQQEGQQPRPGQRGDRSQQMAGNDPAQQPQPGQGGQQPGGEQQGQQPGQQPGQQGGQSPGQQTAQAGGQPGGGGQQEGGEQQGGREGQQPGPRQRGQVADARNPRNLQGGNQRGGGDQRGGFELDRVLNFGNNVGGGVGGWDAGRANVGPLTGEEFNRWAERLRDVGDLVETPEMRNAIASALEQARQLRRDFRQDQKKPDWTVVQLQIIKPLVEVRNRVAEELARRDSKDSLAPIDRDPVPNRFAESVRRYYEELGKDKP